MVKPFYSRKVNYFGNIAFLIICAICFCLPFALKGARMSLDNMQNNVADWLPDHYPETKDLKEFRKYFYGDQFVVVSGPWCKEGDPAFTNLRRKLQEESMDYDRVLVETGRVEERRAHEVGDKLGLLYAGSFHEDFGEQREKWLQGRDKKWYFINRDGELYRWEGENNIVEGSMLVLERMRNGKNKADQTFFIDQFGLPANLSKGGENPYYKDPQLLCCRPFKSVVSGPEVFEQMAGPNGTLRIHRGSSQEESSNSPLASTFEAQIQAHNRLTGALYGVTPAKSFVWTFESLLRHTEDSARLSLLQSDPSYEQSFDDFIEEVVKTRFDSNRQKLLDSTQEVKLELWYRMWLTLEMEAPPRQTCLIVTLNEPVIDELARVVGRPILGKPRGRILELATGECGIAPENVRIGGPPSDNVAIDEEGTRTLFIAWFSFQSIRVTLMLFFVGGTSAIASLSYVWFAGDTMDAILMSMPSLVYVLGLSGAVHIVNYYREACYENGSELAAEQAIAHSWFPCSLAAFTTALGLFSLCTSNLVPISKFGFYAAIATFATIVLLFTYLPSALTIWKPGYEKKSRKERDAEKGLAHAVGRFWQSVGDWVIGHYRIVLVGAVLVTCIGGYGISKIQTQVHLLKLFDPSAKILGDYRWMEANLGELVPAEIVINVDQAAQFEAYKEAAKEKALAQRDAKIEAATTVEEKEAIAATEVIPKIDQYAYDIKLNILERLELSYRVRQQLERFFGPEGTGDVGSGMSTDVFCPLFRAEGKDGIYRDVFSDKLYESRAEMLEQDYLAIDGVSRFVNDPNMVNSDPTNVGREMWRISIRLAALSDVDYGEFISDLKAVIEPIVSAYRHSKEMVDALYQVAAVELPPQDGVGGGLAVTGCKVLVLGSDPDRQQIDVKQEIAAGKSVSELIDQTFIFTDTFKSILKTRGYESKTGSDKHFYWVDPELYRERLASPKLSDKNRQSLNEMFVTSNFVSKYDCVVLVNDDPLFDLEFIKSHAKSFIDCRDHAYLIDSRTKKPLPGMMTAMERKKAGEDIDITAIYTGIVPIVYKAQRSLLTSLIQSILLAFVMISFVMMMLLRDWSRGVGPDNLLNVRGGMTSMIPNIFPIVLVFGSMGLMKIKVDIGSMMTASVAMGIAVDDTIHFLTWYRKSLAEGKNRKAAIKVAYDRVATAMTQTTLIGGLGLAAFALSSFTPTQRFGTLMLFLLAAALIGDLIVLPAVLASPLGKFFGKERVDAVGEDEDELTLRVVAEDAAIENDGTLNGGSDSPESPPKRKMGDE